MSLRALITRCWELGLLALLGITQRPGHSTRGAGCLRRLLLQGLYGFLAGDKLLHLWRKTLRGIWRTQDPLSLATVRRHRILRRKLLSHRNTFWAITKWNCSLDWGGKRNFMVSMKKSWISWEYSRSLFSNIRKWVSLTDKAWKGKAILISTSRGYS